MYSHHMHQSMDQPGKVASPARGHLNRGNSFFYPCPHSRMGNWSREDGFGRPVPRHPAHILNNQAESVAYSWDSSRAFRDGVQLHGQPPSGQSRVYHVAQLRTDGVHCRESAGTRPKAPKVVRAMGATFSAITMDFFFLRLSFPPPTIGTTDMCDAEITGGQ